MTILSSDACSEIMDSLLTKQREAESSVKRKERLISEVTKKGFEHEGLDITLEWDQTNLQIIKEVIDEVESKCGCSVPDHDR